LSHPGLVRELNEDRMLVQPEIGLWLVADGMGGHDAGEIASTEIVDSLGTIGISSSSADQQARFVDRLTRANDQILAYSASHGDRVAGSTVAAVLAFETRFTCYWMGDSRVYRLRRGDLSQLSHDHSEVQELIDNHTLTHEEARKWPRRNVITRAVGTQPKIDVGTTSGTIEVGDAFVLCSDGLTTYADDGEIVDALQGRRAREVCERLVELALSRGGADNITVVVVQCRPLEATVPGEFDALPSRERA
jgi:protein phosphatase